jgi:Outer membrane protein beta-barrel domain
MKKQLIFLLALTLIVSKGYGQLGLQLGWNTTSYHYVSSGLHEKRGLKWGVNAGLLYRTPGKIVCLQPSLLYTQKGAINNNAGASYTTDVDHYKNRLNYLELTIPIILKVPIAGKKNSFDIGAGPYLGRLISAKSKIYYLDGTDRITKFKIGTNDSTDDFKPMDIGISLYMGARIEHFFMSMGYDIGLANAGAAKNETIKNGCFSLNIGVLF